MKDTFKAMATMRKAGGIGLVKIAEINALAAYLENNPQKIKNMTTNEIKRIIGR